MQHEWEKYQIFTDEIGTFFEKLSDDTYQFTTKEGHVDICSKQQMIDWNIQLFTYEK